MQEVPITWIKALCAFIELKAAAPLILSNAVIINRCKTDSLFSAISHK